MNSLQGILKEEERRLQAAKRSYKHEIAKLPKGSIQIKEIKGKAYAYLVYRNGEKVMSEYAGQPSSPGVKALRAQIQDRHRFEMGLKEVVKNQRRVKRMLRGQ